MFACSFFVDKKRLFSNDTFLWKLTEKENEKERKTVNKS